MHSLRKISAYVAGFVIILWLAVPAASQSNHNALSNIQIENFGRVCDTYYRGSQPKGQDYADLAALGIKTVINLIGDEFQPNEEAMVESAGMKYYHIPMTTHVPPTAANLTEFLRIVNDPTDQPVYVHCVGGKHRTGVMTAVHRMTQHGWSAEQAFKEMKQYRFGADFLHREFKRFVYDFYTQLVSTRPAPEQILSVKTANR